MELGRPLYVATAIFLAGVGTTLFAYYRLQRSPIGRTRPLLLVLRVAAVALLAVALLEPTRVSTHEEPVGSQVIVLLDRSQSMTIGDERMGNRRVTRWEAASQAADRLAHRLAERFEVRRYTFDSALHTVAPDESPAPDGRTTDVLRAVNEAVEQSRGLHVAGVLLLTDGAQNVGSAAATDDPGAPVFALGVGSPDAPPDVAVRRVSVEPTLFVGQTATVIAELAAAGYAGAPLRLSLSEGSALLAARTVVAPEGDAAQSVEFTFTPKRAGTVRYTVAASTQPGERATDNNARSVAAQVLPARTRVLFVEGTPRHEFAFLRRVLERVPTMSLRVAMPASPEVLRAQDSVPAAVGSYPMRGAVTLPTSPEMLARYDVVLIGDVPLAQTPAAFRSALGQFVERRGGGVAWLAGERWLGRRFGVGALERLLPVRVPVEGAVVRPVEFAAALAPEGPFHPVTQLADSPETNQRVWQQMPLWRRLYGGLAAKPGATVLVEAKQSGQPVVLFQRVGAGKSLLVATDATWQWGFTQRLLDAREASEGLYERFWTQAVRWLATPADAKQVALYVGQQAFEAGDVVEIAVRAYDVGFLPVEDAAIELTAVGPDGREEDIAVVADGDVPGQYRARLRLSTPGDLRLHARAHARGRLLGEDTAEILVEQPRIEFEHVARNDTLLAALAERSGGKFLPLSQAEHVPELLRASREVRRIRVRQSVWDKPGVLLAAVLLLGAEWALRKRKGLI
jgi:hypothetical protein